jgi:hypothetical protein
MNRRHASWTGLDEKARTAVMELVRQLLHDWIKYMEMWLLSVDFAAPPDDLGRLLDRAVRQTRKKGGQAEGVAEIWGGVRPTLCGIDHPEVAGLVDRVDQLTADLEDLCHQWPARLAAAGGPQAVSELVRAPGRLLRETRAALESLAEDPGA